MDTVIRCHIKNYRRLDDLEKELRSWNSKMLYQLGKVIIVDDGSPLGNELYELAFDHGATYRLAKGRPDTKNGLYWSMKYAESYPIFACVDDAIFGKDITEKLTQLLEKDLNKIPDYGIVGTFACYEDNTRNPKTVYGTDLWEIDNSILYALVGHIFSERMARIIIREWEGVISEEIPYPGMCDDIWVATLLKKYGIKAYNTMKDYTQHIGINNRTFGDNEGSDYVSKMFVGE